MFHGNHHVIARPALTANRNRIRKRELTLL